MAATLTRAPSRPSRRRAGADPVSDVLRRWRAAVESLNAAAADAEALAASIDALPPEDARTQFSGDVREIAKEARHFAWFTGTSAATLEANSPPGV